MSGASIGETLRPGRMLFLESGMTGRLSCESGAWTGKKPRTAGLIGSLSLWPGLPHKVAASGKFSYVAAEGSKYRYFSGTRQKLNCLFTSLTGYKEAMSQPNKGRGTQALPFEEKNVKVTLLKSLWDGKYCHIHFFVKCNLLHLVSSYYLTFSPSILISLKKVLELYLFMQNASVFEK